MWHSQRSSIRAEDEAQGKPWRSALAGHDIDAADEGKERQRLLLERFQEEVRACQHVQEYVK